MEKDKQSDISSAQAVLLGALAPGVNVCCTIIIAVPLLHFYAIILTFFFCRCSNFRVQHGTH
jgi:hypothetical protein